MSLIFTNQPTNFPSKPTQTLVNAQNITLSANYKRCAFIIYQIRLSFTQGSNYFKSHTHEVLTVIYNLSNMVIFHTRFQLL